ncbi:MAG TPA: phosphoglucosamine mutase [Gammaproteobacteria bacterium]|nr:phosphoglucosamine mutase [Gammaproteobacteria bacterium]|tara:strand:- start:135 stop:1478 length:1344 start_codon:yes stop_codon:yes gene_type:complete
MKQKYFGTDGIRGRVGEHPITPEFCLRLSNAVGRVFTVDGRKPKVLIGKDTRISGYMLESVLQSGLISAGADVSLLGPMPTPAIAYLTRTLRADAAIVISASHNPYYDNGIKFFDAQGSKLDDATELAIEAAMDLPLYCEGSETLGKASRISDAPGRYVEFCKAAVPNGLSLRGLRLVLDCAHGATYQVAPQVFAELGADVVVMAAEPDGFNINEECGSTHTRALQERVLAEKADLGIAFDGDGDRVAMVDANGVLLDGDELLYIIARDRQRREVLHGGVVGTVMSNLGFEQALTRLAIPFSRANVGDRNILAQLQQRGWQLGGEPSGHILTLDLATTGDAIVAALQVVVPVVEQGESLHTLVRGMDKFPQILQNVTVAEPGKLSSDQRLLSEIAAHENELAERGRILVRASGTEPLLRIMVEGQDEKEVGAIAQALADHAIRLSAH